MTLDPITLRARLRGVVSPNARALAPESDVCGPTAMPLPGQPSTPMPARMPDGSIDRVLGGAWHESESGRCFVVRRRVPPDAWHGRSRVSDLAAAVLAAPGEAALLAPSDVGLPFLFFDLETTGLNGGAGTHAFLVGCARFEIDGSFVTEQHLLVDFAGERSMLASVAHELAAAGAIVSFNGKSFDAPVLETRYGFHRLPFPCDGRPHLDVLHPARRFWGGIDETGCSLGVLEKHVLGAPRVGDIAGAEIPSRYFQFIRTGDAGPLRDVLEHNRLDLLSLAGVTARLLSMLARGAGAAESAREALALGWVYRRGGELARAADAFERAVRLASDDQAGQTFRNTLRGVDRSRREILADAHHALALMARRNRRHSDAAAHWQRLLDVPDCPPSLSREAAEALAIHHEHRARDLAAARLFALKTLEGGTTSVARSDASRHRLARIERKMVSERRWLFPSSP